VKSHKVNYTIVYIEDEDIYGEIVSHGAYASKIHYLKDGFEYEIILLNDEFEIVEEINIEEIEED
jgi:hypothetical protein